MKHCNLHIYIDDTHGYKSFEVEYFDNALCDISSDRANIAVVYSLKFKVSDDSV